ncbi:uncharacterized protein LOC120012494 [Tripterygium wilfordii]|uniref:uncharacterized protein LOC120012494 n=1 Tax=Tripterygium wilfordii TaxID=458696 RepID=UPI0018F84F83|nr:uncharacterized protein LOC120012494 [Tripterygium wilfordii]
MLEKIRREKDKGEWMRQRVRDDLHRIWANPEYVKKREKGKMNRLSYIGKIVHTCGSILHLEHYKRLKKEYGRVSSITTSPHRHRPQRVDSSHILSRGFMEVIRGFNKKVLVYGLGLEAHCLCCLSSSSSERSR